MGERWALISDSKYKKTKLFIVFASVETNIQFYMEIH